MSDLDEAQLLLTEYEALKKEQVARINHRDNIIYTTLAAVAAIVAATVSSHNSALLLTVAPATVLLGWTYSSNDHKVSAIGRYIRDHVATRLAAIADRNGQQVNVVFGWEIAFRLERGRRARKWMQLVVDLLGFCVAPVAALMTWWSTSPVSGLLLIVSGAEALLVGALTTFFVFDTLRPTVGPRR